MNTAIRSFLIELARNRINPTITYKDLCEKLGLKYDMSIPNDRLLLGKELEEISRNEFVNGRSLLSSLVVRKLDLEEGDGFYKMCENLGYGSWRKLKKDFTFQTKIINETVEFWNDEANYFRFR